MKPTPRKNMLLALFLAVFGAGTAFAGDPPVSPTSGVIQVTLPASVTSALAVPFAKSLPLGGSITTVAGTTLGVDVALTPGALTNHSIYIATLADPSAGGAYGRMVRITGNTATEVTTETAITPVAGDGFDIIENHTLESLFGAFPATVALTSGSSLALSDVVFIESNGVFTGYWHRSGQGWRLQSDTTGTGSSQNGVSIPFGKGVLVARKGGSRTVTIKGESIVGRFRPVTVGSGASNLLNNVFSVDTTLGASGIDSFITRGSSATLSDVLYIENGGVFTGYWRKSTGNWYLESDNSGSGAVQNSVVIQPGKALLFKDRGAAGFAFPQPFKS
jgi:hypothetical protein